MARGRIAAVVFLVLVLVVVLALGWRHRGPNTFEAAFQPGGTVDLDLSIGGYEIRGTNENQIRVEIHPFDTRSVQSEIKVNGKTASVRVEGQPNNFRAIIYVPQQTNLNAHQTIGQLRVVNVEGDKYLGLNIGQIRVDMPDTAKVKAVDAAVTIGSVRAGPWQTDKGGFFRAFRAGGHGPYTVSAHLDIGDIELD
jgi:hypothetical protein